MYQHHYRCSLFLAVCTMTLFALLRQGLPAADAVSVESTPPAANLMTCLKPTVTVTIPPQYVTSEKIPKRGEPIHSGKDQPFIPARSIERGQMALLNILTLTNTCGFDVGEPQGGNPARPELPKKAQNKKAQNKKAQNNRSVLSLRMGGDCAAYGHQWPSDTYLDRIDIGLIKNGTTAATEFWSWADCITSTFTGNERLLREVEHLPVTLYPVLSGQAPVLYPPGCKPIRNASRHILGYAHIDYDAYEDPSFKEEMASRSQLLQTESPAALNRSFRFILFAAAFPKDVSAIGTTI